MIGRELQSPEEILPRFRNPARPRFQHAQVVPVIGVICPQMKSRLSFRNRRLQLPRTGQRLRQLRVQVRIGRRQGDRLPQLDHRIAHAPRQRIRGGELLVSIHILGSLFDGALQQIRGLLGLTSLKRQTSQVVKSGEIVGIDLQRSTKLGLRGISVAFAVQSGAEPAVYRRVSRTLRQHGAKLLLSSTRLIVLQLRTRQVESGIASFRMVRNILQEHLLRLLPVPGVLKRSAEFIQCAFIARMQGQRVPINDEGILILALRRPERRQGYRAG